MVSNRNCSSANSRSPLGRQLIGVDAACHAQSDPSFTPRPTLFQKEFDLTGRVAVVSGGNGRLGLEIAMALCEAGAIVHCLDRAAPGDIWRATQTYIERFELPLARLEYAQVDVTDQQAVWNVVEKIAEKEGRLDVGVAAAGIIQNTPCLQYSREEFKKVLDVNLSGAFHTAQASGRQMEKYGIPGSIILISSAAGSVANKGHEVIAYNASKAALLQVARSMACELGPKNIRVNTISPGYIRTNLTSAFLDALPGLEQEWSSQNPLGRLGRPDELRGAAAWLASDASTFCTGSEYVDDVQLMASEVIPERAPFVKTRDNFEAKYSGKCFCGAVGFDIAEDPLDASYCHCLHGAPYQWAAILPKDAVFFSKGQKDLVFYNSPDKSSEYKLPCKLSCARCRSPLADEGRNMMLMFPVAIDFEGGQIPGMYLVGCICRFYGSRVADVPDGIPKFLGKKGDRPYEEGRDLENAQRLARWHDSDATEIN
ncbi:NAD-binding protein [Phellopilus nigrolimitatus]|nr:NAD-binding protein [Phellopilus nigrolimitatus]